MSLVRKFLRDSGIYGVAMILSKGLTILLVPVYTALLTKAEVGMLDLLLGGVAIASLLIGLDISNALAREYGDAHDEHLRKRFSSTALWFSVGVFGTASALGLLAAPIIADWAFESQPEATGAVGVAVVSMGISGVYLVVVQQLRWMLRPVHFGIVSITYTAASLGATILLAGPAGLGVAGVFGGMTLGALAGTVLAHTFSRGEFGWTFDWGLLRKMLRFCVPLIPSSLAVVVGQYVSRFFIERHLGLEDVGIFAVSLRIAGLMGLVMLGVGSALTPLIYANQHDAATPGQLGRIFKIFVSLASLGLGVFALFIPEILAVLAQGNYNEARQVLPWLAPAVLLAQMYVFAPGPWIARRTSLVATINVSTAVMAIFLNAALIPRLGIFGAAVATLTYALVTFIASMGVSQRLYPVPHRWARLLIILGPGLVTMVLAMALPGDITLGLIAAKVGIAVCLFAAIASLGGLELDLVRAKIIQQWGKIFGNNGMSGKNEG